MNDIEYMTELGFSPILIYKEIDIEAIKKVNSLAERTPFKGIYFFSGINHFVNLTKYLYNCLSSGKLRSIFHSTFYDLYDRINDFDSVFTGFDICIISNINPEEKRIEPMVSVISAAMSKEVPTILSTPYSLDKFETYCSPLLLSLILPYILDGINED